MSMAAREEEECYRGNRRRSIGKMNAVFHPWPIREFRDRSDGIPESGVQGRFSSAHEFKHGGLSYRAERMDGNNGRVRGTPRRRRPAWPSQFGDFEVSVPASGSDRGWPRGQTETVENLASDGRILNSGQNAHPAATAWGVRSIMRHLIYVYCSASFK